MSSVTRIASVGLFLLAASCNGADDITFEATCSTLARALAHGEQSSIGLTGAEVVAWAEEAWKSVDVRWSGEVQPTSETFAFTFGAPIDTREMSADGPPGVCPPSAWVEVTLPLEITSASGHLSAEGTAVLRGFYDDDQELRVYVSWPGNAPPPTSVVAGPYLQQAESQEQGLEKVWLSLGSRGWGAMDLPQQSVTVTAVWDLGSRGGKIGTVYDCRLVGNSCLMPADGEP